MPTAYEIPLRPSVPQSFSITLAGTNYQMFVQWREAMAQCWLLDLMDGNGNILIAGVPLLPGADILGQYSTLDFGGQLLVVSDGNSTDPPTFSSLGVTSHLYFVTFP